jgi:hypothetical protein
MNVSNDYLYENLDCFVCLEWQINIVSFAPRAPFASDATNRLTSSRKGRMN